MSNTSTPNLSVIIGNVTFANPIFVASGTFGYGSEVARVVDVSKLGAIVTKSLSAAPRQGNAPHRIAETPSGMLNSIGLANVGVEAFITEKLPFLRSLGTRIIANIAASTTEEYCNVLARLETEEGIDGYEINVSCPNVKEGGLQFGTDPKMVREITRRLRALTKKLLIIKLTPNVTSVAEFALVCEGEGADAVSCINTLVGMAIDYKKRTPLLSTITGGLSGPAIKPVALVKVYEVRKASKIPIIGIGGIMNARDAMEFMIAGAVAVQVGTANFIDPDAGLRIIQELKGELIEQKVFDVREIVGTLKC